MSFCRWRGRPRLGRIRESESRRPNGLHYRNWSDGNARTESAATARITRFSTAVHSFRPFILNETTLHLSAA